MAAAASPVIVVGGGPVGMTAAHALSRAGIDFILLESRSTIVLDAGSNLVLSPTGLRALSQFGILPALNKVSSPLAKFRRFDHQRRDIGDTLFFTYVQQNHGEFPRVISRHDLMQVLWDALPAETASKLHTNKKVSHIRTTETGVVVHCADGTSYLGSMVIGADGTYSSVRKYIDAMVSQDETKDEAAEKTAEKEAPFLTTYRCLWVRFPMLPGVVAGDASESHGPVATTQYFAGEETAVVGVYEKLEEPTRHPRRWTADDEAAFVDKWGHLPLTNGDSLTLREAYAQKQQSGLVNLEEGVAPNWNHGGRAVLVGDAAHKFTPSTGAGCNNGIIDVVVLANKLNQAFASSKVPSTDELATAFHDYQNTRQEAVASSCRLSGNATATATWDTFLLKILDLYILSSQLVQRFFVSRIASIAASAPVFNYIEGKEEIKGAVPWACAIPSGQPQK
ncbi:FAD/NAD(P)-binding domain-containing protein [Colletotrichum zoysiae]|uniref:FAD/NAD(P)-binding domain-containing protein n=1 Tax=Colletotrichum zoysiae TaxID=1216348 RepID=A0AAD9LXB1_9PEZI|nr:FAD/NAD(P)-binding domain-containing protein [Colletotrichum zoysiae]